MHGSKYAQLGAEQVRPDHRRRHRASTTASPARSRRSRPGAKVIHFDIDAAEIGKIREAEIPVVGPLKLALAQLTRDVKALEAETRDRPHRLARAARGVARALPVQVPPRRGRAQAADRDRDAARPDRRAASDVIWTTGVGQHQMWAMQYLQCEKPRTFITSGGLGTMGYGLPAAVGAKAARPDATVVCIDGDGCFQMTCQELATAALERLPIVVVIVNNGWLGMVRQWQELFYAERYAETHLTKQVPDYAAARRGARLRRLHGRQRGRPRRRRSQAALDCGRTAVVDARVDPDENCYPMVPAGAASVDMIELPDEDEAAGEGHRMSHHTVSVELENKPGRARARLAAVRAARLQHPEPRGRPDRAARHLAADAARRLLRALARADREADAQARQRPARHRAPARRVGRARARADHRRRAARQAGRADRARRGLRRPRRRHRPRRAHLRDRRPARGARRLRGARPPARRARARPHRADRPAPARPASSAAAAAAVS